MNVVYKQSTAPTSNPVSMAEAQAYLKTAYTSNDSEYSLIQTLLTAATDLVQRKTGIQMMSATYTITMKYWQEYLELWPSPVLSISSVKYYDTSNTQQTLAATNYELNSSRKPAILKFLDMPTLDDREEAIEIIYLCGHTSSTNVTSVPDSTVVPYALKVAVLMITGHMYENRQTVSTMQTYEVPQAADWLMESHKVYKNPFETACT